MARYAKQKTPQAVRNPFEPMLKTVEQMGSCFRHRRKSTAPVDGQRRVGVHPERQPSPDFRTGDLGLLQPCQDPGKVCKWWVLIWRSAREKSKTSETAKEF